MKQYLMNVIFSASTFGVGRVNCSMKLFLMILKMAKGRDSILSIATGWPVRESNPGGGKIFCVSPDHFWDAPSPPYNRYQVIHGSKAAETWLCWSERHTRVGTLRVATIYLQLIQNRYMFRSFAVLQCSHQHCVQPVASDVEVVGYL